MEDTITTDKLKAKLDQKGITLVETLAPARYREAHIPNKDAEIVTYCTNTH
jgi:rhodanese-related sulfurtransferase